VKYITYHYCPPICYYSLPQPLYSTNPNSPPLSLSLFLNPAGTAAANTCSSSSPSSPSYAYYITSPSYSYSTTPSPAIQTTISTANNACLLTSTCPLSPITIRHPINSQTISCHSFTISPATSNPSTNIYSRNPTSIISAKAFHPLSWEAMPKPPVSGKKSPPAATSMIALWTGFGALFSTSILDENVLEAPTFKVVRPVTLSAAEATIGWRVDCCIDAVREEITEAAATFSGCFIFSSIGGQRLCPASSWATSSMAESREVCWDQPTSVV
jgi:hypothetical protein